MHICLVCFASVKNKAILTNDSDDLFISIFQKTCFVVNQSCNTNADILKISVLGNRNNMWFEYKSKRTHNWKHKNKIFIAFHRFSLIFEWNTNLIMGIIFRRCLLWKPKKILLKNCLTHAISELFFHFESLPMACGVLIIHVVNDDSNPDAVNN